MFKGSSKPVGSTSGGGSSSGGSSSKPKGEKRKADSDGSNDSTLDMRRAGCVF